MHELHRIEHDLKDEARRISERYKGAPVIVIVGGTGDEELDLKRTMTASSYEPGEEGRLRDLLGILQAAIQIESSKHTTARRSTRA